MRSTRNPVDRWSWFNARKRTSMYLTGNPKRIQQYFKRTRRTLGFDIAATW